VKICIDIYASELGIIDKTDKTDLPIIVTTRMTNGLGVYRVRRVGKNIKPFDLRFSHNLLNGQYTLEMVDSIISHEVIHYLCYLLYSRRCKHGVEFKAMCKKFNCKEDGGSVKTESYQSNKK